MEDATTNSTADENGLQDSPKVTSTQAAPRTSTSCSQVTYVGATILMSAAWVGAFFTAATLDGLWGEFGIALVSLAVLMCAVGVLVTSVQALSEHRRFATHLLALACVTLLGAVTLIQAARPQVREGPCTDWHGNVQPCDR